MMRKNNNINDKNNGAVVCFVERFVCSLV